MRLQDVIPALLVAVITVTMLTYLVPTLTDTLLIPSYVGEANQPDEIIIDENIEEIMINETPEDRVNDEELLSDKDILGLNQL